SGRRRHTRWPRDWSSDVCSSDLAAAGEPCGMTPARNRLAARLDADETHVAIVDERVEHPDGVAPPADARDDRVRQAAGELEDLQIGRASCRGRVEAWGGGAR